MKRLFKFAIVSALATVCIVFCGFAFGEVATVTESAMAEYGSCEAHIYPNNGEYTVVGEATCSATATMYRKCVVCGYNDIFQTPKNPDNHTLVSTDWAYNPIPNCVNGGIKYKVCYDCGEIIAQENVPADPDAHVVSEANVTVKEPTCSTEGIKGSKCRYCSQYFDFESIPVNSDNHVVSDNSVWQVTQLPTCNEQGSVAGLCDECGRVAQRRPIEPTGKHTPLQEWVVDSEPTCVADGSKSQHCTECDSPVNIQVIPMSPDNHSFSDEYTVDIPATCISEGLMSKHCLYCDVTKDVYSINIDPSAHSYTDEWIVSKAPACDKTGLKHKVCTLCGKDSVSTMIETVPHTYPEEYEIVKESADGLSAQVKYICTECSSEYVTIITFGTNNGDGDIGNDTFNYLELSPVQGTVIKVDYETMVISNVIRNMTVSDFMSKFTNSTLFAIYDADGNFANEEDIITTGCRLNYSTVSGWNTDYYVSVTGDLDCDGKITAADARIVLRAAAKLQTLEAAYFSAADVNADGRILANDARKTLLVAAGVEIFDETYER